MPSTPSDIRRALLLAAMVFAGVAALSVWLLLGSDAGRLAGRLALAFGLAATGAAICLAWTLLHSGPDQTPGEADLDRSASTPPGRVERASEQMVRLEGEREHLLTVLGSMSEGVLVVDGDGRTVLVNRSWRELFGVTGDVEGRTALELTRQSALDRLIAEALASGRGDQIEVEVTGARGLTAVMTSSPLPDGAGAVVLAKDLTPFLRAGEIRRDFVANVSHELKTPLSAIRGFAETLHDGALDDREAAERFTERILRQCQRLEALLSDLLTLSRLEHPTARAGWTEVDLASVLREAIDLIEEAARERGLEVDARIDPVPPIRGDSEALTRMCINLLENAIKYNRPGGRVEAGLQRTGDSLELRVSDTGIGIPREAIDRLFERFYRVDKGRSREEGGTGLGLAIVKHATQLHGGSVAVESEVDQGTTFRVTLPIG